MRSESEVVPESGAFHVSVFKQSSFDLFREPIGLCHAIHNLQKMKVLFPVYHTALVSVRFTFSYFIFSYNLKLQG